MAEPSQARALCVDGSGSGLLSISLQPMVPKSSGKAPPIASVSS